jgi:hypothetical protein
MRDAYTLPGGNSLRWPQFAHDHHHLCATNDCPALAHSVSSLVAFHQPSKDLANTQRRTPPLYSVFRIRITNVRETPPKTASLYHARFLPCPLLVVSMSASCMWHFEYPLLLPSPNPNLPKAIYTTTFFFERKKKTIGIPLNSSLPSSVQESGPCHYSCFSLIESKEGNTVKPAYNESGYYER